MMSHPKMLCVLVLIKKILNYNIQWRPTHNPQRKENFSFIPLFIGKTEFRSSYSVVFRFMGFLSKEFLSEKIGKLFKFTLWRTYCTPYLISFLCICALDKFYIYIQYIYYVREGKGAVVWLRN